MFFLKTRSKKTGWWNILQVSQSQGKCNTANAAIAKIWVQHDDLDAHAAAAFPKSSNIIWRRQVVSQAELQPASHVARVSIIFNRLTFGTCNGRTFQEMGSATQTKNPPFSEGVLSAQYILSGDLHGHISNRLSVKTYLINPTPYYWPHPQTSPTSSNI